MKHPSAPGIILIALTLIFLGATIDLVGNSLAYTYKLLKPILCEVWVFTLESLSNWLQSTGADIESYFYHIDNTSCTIPSVLDAFCCSIGVDLGRLMKYIGRRIKMAFE